MGAIGLGVGTVTEYLDASDQIRFYEIDPHVIELANDYFNYLQQARAQVEIVQGDARLSLARELADGGGRNYDVLIEVAGFRVCTAFARNDAGCCADLNPLVAVIPAQLVPDLVR